MVGEYGNGADYPLLKQQFRVVLAESWMPKIPPSHNDPNLIIFLLGRCGDSGKIEKYLKTVLEPYPVSEITKISQ